MARIIQYVKRTKAKGRFYYYFDTGQVDEKGKRVWKRLPDPSDRSFGGIYAALLGHRSRRENVEALLTVKKLVELYQASAQFEKLKPNTQKVYRRLRKSGGNLPYFRIPPKNPPETYQIDSAVTENFSTAISGGR